LNVDAYAIQAAAGTATTSDVQRRRIRRGSAAVAATTPRVSATQLPRENVKYSVVAAIGIIPALASARGVLLAWAATPRAMSTPMAASSPSEFQYPSGAASRYELAASS
jgi:hypothetical protein